MEILGMSIFEMLFWFGLGLSAPFLGNWIGHYIARKHG